MFFCVVISSQQSEVMQNLVKGLRPNFSTVEDRSPFLQKAPFQMFDRVLNAPLIVSGLQSMGSFIQYVRKIFRKDNISHPLIHRRTCALQGVRNVNFSENFAYIKRSTGCKSIQRVIQIPSLYNELTIQYDTLKIASSYPDQINCWL